MSKRCRVCEKRIPMPHDDICGYCDEIEEAEEAERDAMLKIKLVTEKKAKVVKTICVKCKASSKIRVIRYKTDKTRWIWYVDRSDYDLRYWTVPMKVVIDQHTGLCDICSKGGQQ